MIMPTEENALRRRVSLPWESIDPGDNVSAPFDFPAAEAPVGQVVDSDDADDNQPVHFKPVAVLPALSAKAKRSRFTDESPAAILQTPDDPQETTAPESTTVVLERDESGALKVAVGKEETAEEESNENDRDRKASDGGAPMLAYAGGNPARRDNSGWTVTILCIGLALIAACVIIPQADSNRRLAYEREKLQLDLNQIQKQVAVNDEFLKKIETDPQLVQRVAERQMKLVRQGESVVDLKLNAQSAPGDAEVSAASQDAEQMSPFRIVNVPPPPPMQPYTPVGGVFADLCRDPHSQLYLLGAALFMVAAGLVLGDSRPKAQTA